MTDTGPTTDLDRVRETLVAACLHEDLARRYNEDFDEDCREVIKAALAQTAVGPLSKQVRDFVEAFQAAVADEIEKPQGPRACFKAHVKMFQHAMDQRLPIARLYGFAVDVARGNLDPNGIQAVAQQLVEPAEKVVAAANRSNEESK